MNIIINIIIRNKNKSVSRCEKYESISFYRSKQFDNDFSLCPRKLSVDMFLRSYEREKLEKYLHEVVKLKTNKHFD